MSEIIYREATMSDWDDAMLLAWKTFQKFEAPEYSDEGIKNFKDFVFDDRLKQFFINGDYLLFVAVEEGRLVGIISSRNVNHISLLFVDENYHRMGIGRNLVEHLSKELIRRFRISLLTVNAAPYAEGFYHSIGFIDRGLRTESEGILYTPMELYI